MVLDLFLYVFPFLLLACFLLYWAGARRAYARRRPSRTGDPAAFTWHFFVPCRDEEAVIETTVTRLRADFPGGYVWVIDDASEDRTGSIVGALAARHERVHLVSRRLPDDRNGKGAALNQQARRDARRGRHRPGRPGSAGPRDGGAGAHRGVVRVGGGRGADRRGTSTRWCPSGAVSGC
ncbi:glycosyltransferase [Streptomyces sp. NPDC001665]